MTNIKKMMERIMEGKKNDQNKLYWRLLPFAELEDVVRSLTHGAERYEDNNWKKVMPTSRYEDACYRHLVAFSQGYKLDNHNDNPTKNTYLPHLALVAVNALFRLFTDRRDNPDDYEGYVRKFAQSMAEIRQRNKDGFGNNGTSGVLPEKHVFKELAHHHYASFAQVEPNQSKSASVCVSAPPTSLHSNVR